MKNDRPQFEVLNDLVKWQSIVRREQIEKDLAVSAEFKLLKKDMKKFNELANDSYKAS